MGGIPGEPEGFRYVPELITEDEERALLAALAGIELGPVKMHGVIARRRVAHFGWTYGYLGRGVLPGTPIPPELLRLRDRAAPLAGLAPEALEEALVTHYPPGAGIGWHRDAPQFGPTVIGISLGAPCRFRLKRGEEAVTRILAPRSAYVLAGPARAEWQHHIPPVAGPRWSVTFRTVKPRPPARSRRGSGRGARPRGEEPAHPDHGLRDPDQRPGDERLGGADRERVEVRDHVAREPRERAQRGGDEERPLDVRDEPDRGGGREHGEREHR